MKKKKRDQAIKNEKIFLVILTITIMISVLASLQTTQALTRTNNSSTNYNLSIWDDTENPPITERSTYNVTFYANYTNITGANVPDTCSIRFNFTGTYGAYVNMTYNTTALPYYYNRTFTYKGNHTFEVWCYNASAQSILQENFLITNTIPVISKESGADWINFDGSSLTHDILGCVEDTICTYNMTANITEPDTNDNLTFSLGSNYTVNSSIFSINVSTGILKINATLSKHNGTDMQIELKVRDTESLDQGSLLALNITEINDVPLLQNFQNITINATEPGNNFTSVIFAIDEEPHLPLRFNVTFSSCILANWSSRNTGPNCTIWNVTQYNTTYNTTAMFVNFTPAGRDDVGNYTINISVTDNASGYGFAQDGQKNYSLFFVINNINEAPNLTYICGQEFGASTPYFNISENTPFSCYVNASDIDELANLTYVSNFTWFLNATNVTPVNYNSSTAINFTPDDYQVGNWSINISVLDNIGYPPNKYSSRLIRLQVFNVNDSVSLFPTTNFTGFNGNTYTLYINATDNDLLVPNKNVSNGGFNESINFTAKNMSGSTIPWITIAKTGDTNNRSQVSLTFTANSTTLGNNTINLSVVDNNGFSGSNFIFIIQLVGNSAPEWSIGQNFTVEENTNFYLNLSNNVSDPDGDLINFSYYNLSQTQFPEFYNGSNSQGIINFTPIDIDVGYHNITINASDGRTPGVTNISIYVSNINDTPTIDSFAGPTVSEDSSSGSMQINVRDNDFRIKQKGIYNENISFNFTIVGPNTNLFNLTLLSVPTPSQPDLMIYSATFTPNKSDLGGALQKIYNVYVQAQDQSGLNATSSFTITINSINHAPNITQISNQSTYQGANLTIRMNITDREDNSTDSGGTYNITYSFLQGTSFANSSTFNTSTGIINLSINSTISGSYHINVSVNDTSNAQSSMDFWINVYDQVRIVAYNPTVVYSSENSTIMINMTGNHTVGDNLNYTIIIDGIVRNTSVGNGAGGANVTLALYLNLTDETTCGGAKNLTINISNPYFSNTTIINLSVNHTNYPVSFASIIANTTAGGSITYTLTDYFSDGDVNSNTCNNYSVEFSFLRMNSSFSQISGSFTATITNWTNSSGELPKFNVSTSTVTGIEYFQIIANDTYSLAKSNNFSVNLTPSSTSVTTPSSGGGVGGGGGASRPVSLKLLLPDKISSFKYDQIVVPLTLLNSGQTKLTGINLKSLVVVNENVTGIVNVSFGQTFFDSLTSGQKKTTNMTISIDTKKTGRVEIIINGTVRDPSFSDWGKFFLDIIETNKTEVEQIILFTDELLVQNPECAELKESLDRAKKALAEGKADEAWQYSNEVVRACKNSIAQRPTIIGPKTPTRDILVYLVSGTLGILSLIFVYHLFNRMRMRREPNFSEFKI
ncbi:MAG: hypothetical protein AABW73_00935 [Nanoarchaeota archaeon]